MPLLNRPLTDEEVQALAGDLYPTIPAQRDTLFGPPPHQMVVYRASLDRVNFVRSDVVYWHWPASPSDCVWMVPSGIEAPLA